MQTILQILQMAGGWPHPIIGTFARMRSSRSCVLLLISRADPPWLSPVLRLAKICRIFVANTAHLAGFADSADL
jgi:hypothetical protein